MKKYINYFLGCFSFFLSMISCSTEEYLLNSVVAVKPNFSVGQTLAKLLNEQDTIWKYTCEICPGRTFLFDEATYSFSSDFGWHYSLPIQSSNKEIEGCVIYCLQSLKGRMDDIKLTGRLDFPILLDAEKLSEMKNSYISSAGFKKLREKGLNVSKKLALMADSVDLAESQKRIKTRIGESNQCIGDLLRIIVYFEIIPGFAQNGSELVVISVSQETFDELAKFCVNVIFPYADFTEVHSYYDRVPFMLYIDIWQDDYFYFSEVSYDVSRMLDLLANEVLNEHVSGFTYEYSFSGFFEKLPRPEDEIGNVGVSGGGSGGGSVSGDKGDETLPSYEERFDHIFDNFLLIKLRELGISRNSAILDTVKNDTLYPQTYAHYNSDTGILTVFEDRMLAADLTEEDIRSCVYHEYVHVKQRWIDNIFIERDIDGNIITQKYEKYYSQSDVDVAYNRYYEVLEIEKIPREGGNELQKKKRELYYNMYVLPYSTAFQQHIPYIIEMNEQVVRGEVEAYMRQHSEYMGRMSEEYEKQVMDNMFDFMQRLKIIENQ